MNEFQNKLIIKVENYTNGLFVEVPNFRKRGSAFVFTEGINNDIKVDENTTTKQIRKGKYTQLVEISTLPYMKEIRLDSISKQNAYSFEVYIKAVIQVKDPIRFYENSNLDVDAYFENLLSMDVRKITRKYSVLAYEGMDLELFQKLSSYSTVDEATGFGYSISVVDAVPGKGAQAYVERVSNQEMEAAIKKNAREQVDNYTLDFEKAIMTEVAEGKVSETDAIRIMREYKDKISRENIMRIKECLADGILTDKQVKEAVMSVLNIRESEKAPAKETRMNEFYKGEDEG